MRQKLSSVIIFHRNLGTQYTTANFKKRFDFYEIIKGLCDKETLTTMPEYNHFSRLLRKSIQTTRFKAFEGLCLGCFDFIEGWCNRNRVHSNPNY